MARSVARCAGGKLRPLTVAFIPRTMWWRNVRAVVSNETWEELRYRCGATDRKPPFPKFSYRHRPGTLMVCAYCRDANVPLQLHEEWDYDEAKLMQRLVALAPICERCHLATHLGYANRRGRGDEALDHLSKVNGWNAKQVQAHVHTAIEAHDKRSDREYELDLGYLKRYGVQNGRVHLDWLDTPRTWLRGRFDAIMWASALLETDSAVILDTETTGLPDKYPKTELIELAVINTHGKTIYKSLFRPLHVIPRRTTDIHGIRDKDVKHAPSFAEQISRIREALHGKIVVAYKAEFDRRVISNTCIMHGVARPDCRWECAMFAYRAFMGSPRLLQLPDGEHRALPDARATLQLVRSMAINRSDQPS